MLRPEHNTTACLIGIDPGSQTLGLCAIYFDVITLQLKSVDAHTFTGDKLPYDNPVIQTYHGDRPARLAAHEENLYNIFYLTKPIGVVCESPFFNPLRPSAFAPLVETLEMIKRSYYRYDPYSSVMLVDPPTVKNAVGAKGNAGKEDVFKAILAMQGIPFTVPPTQLSEHALDAFAVAYSRYKTYRPFPFLG